MACSDGFRTMDLAFSVPVTGTGIWHFPALGFYFSPRRDSGGAGYRFGLLLGDFLPFVGWRVFGVAVGQAKQVWPAPFSIAGTARFGDFDKAEGDDFTDRRPD